MSQESNKYSYEYFIFTDPHTLGGQSFTLIKKEEILSNYKKSGIHLKDEELIQNFLTINFATPLTKTQYFNLLKINNDLLLRNKK